MPAHCTLGYLSRALWLTIPAKAERFQLISSNPDYHVAVVEGKQLIHVNAALIVCYQLQTAADHASCHADPQTGRVVGAATVVIENKFVHACNKVCVLLIHANVWKGFVFKCSSSWCKTYAQSLVMHRHPWGQRAGL